MNQSSNHNITGGVGGVGTDKKNSTKTPHISLNSRG